MLYLLIGISLGVIAASSRVPTFRWTPMIGSILLLASVLFTFPDLALLTFADAIYLIVGLVLATVLYAGFLWLREDIEPGVSYWEWVRRDITHPRYLRALYRESNCSKPINVTNHSG